MAKLRLPPNITLAEVIPQLAEIGITVDPHQLPDGSYRTYVRKDHMQRFLAATQQKHRAFLSHDCDNRLQQGFR